MSRPMAQVRFHRSTPRTSHRRRYLLIVKLWLRVLQFPLCPIRSRRNVILVAGASVTSFSLFPSLCNRPVSAFLYNLSFDYSAALLVV